jgi:hypothetical protein
LVFQVVSFFLAFPSKPCSCPLPCMPHTHTQIYIYMKNIEWLKSSTSFVLASLVLL